MSNPRQASAADAFETERMPSQHISAIRNIVNGLLDRLERHPASAEGAAYRQPAEHGASLPAGDAAAFEAALCEQLRDAGDGERGEIYFLLGGCRLLAGDLMVAGQAFLLCAAEEGGDADGCRWLGHLYFGFGQISLARRYYGFALALRPDDAALLRHMSCTLYADRRSAAVTLLQRAVRLDPGYVEGNRNLARCELAQNSAPESINRYRRVIASAPEHAEAWRNLGNAAFALRRMDEAETDFRRAARLDPLSVPAHSSMADVLLLKSATDEAMIHLRAAAGADGRSPSVRRLDEAAAADRLLSDPAAVAVRDFLAALPTYDGPQEPGAAALLLRAYARGACGDNDGCLADLRRVEALRPGDLVIRLDRVLAELAAGAVGEDGPAAEAETIFYNDNAMGVEWLHSLLLLSEVHDGLSLPGSLWRRSLSQDDDVWRRARRALAMALQRPAAADGRYGLMLCAVTFEADGSGSWRDHLRAWTRRFSHFDRKLTATALDQAWKLMISLGAPGAERSGEIADILFENDNLLLGAWLEAFRWVGYADAWLDAVFTHTPAMLRFVDGRPDIDDLLPHLLLAACFLSRDDGAYAQVADFWVRRLQGWEHWRRFADRVPPTPADGRISVGYVVHDFRYQDFCPEHNVLRLHDAAHFDVSVYFMSPRHSPWCRRLEGLPPLLRDFPGRVRDINGLSPEESAARIADDGVGVLFDTFGWWAEEIPQIFAQRPAPIQATWCGLSRPGKRDVIDYIIGNDDLFPPGTDQGIPERIVRLDGSYIPVKPRSHVTGSLPRSFLGVDDNSFVFLGYHQLMKVNGQTLDLWMDIVRRCPDSVLVLNRMHPMRIERVAQRHGVDPRRILFFTFVKTEIEHLMRLGIADLFLDTTPFTSAGLTGVDAIYMGVPRITLTESNLYSRFGKILMNAVGLGDWVCHNRDEFVARAVDLYNDRAALQALKRRIRTEVALSEALEPASVLRKIERATEIMWARREAGLSPESFRV